jgi:hypothetical protein
MKILKDEWLFISTRKCATNSMYEALPGERIDSFHALTNKRLAPIHWTIVRNPYDRALSIWGSTCNRPDNGRNEKWGAKDILGDDKSFKRFAQIILQNPHGSIFRNMSYFHNQCLIDDFAKIENLQEDVKRITGLDINIPQMNTSPHNYVLDEEDIENVNKWAKEDFERYGYDKL